MLFVFFILILKFVVYYTLTYEIYIYSSNKNSIDMKRLEMLEKVKHYTGIITGFFLLFVSFYVIRKVLI